MLSSRYTAYLVEWEFSLNECSHLSLSQLIKPDYLYQAKALPRKLLLFRRPFKSSLERLEDDWRDPTPASAG